MEQLRKIEIFRHEAAYRLPGILYSFNIADLKRRNAHLGFRAGDKDIEELGRLLTAMESDSVLVARTHANRWLMLASREEKKDPVQDVLDRYRKTESFWAGWEIKAFKSGQEKVCRETVSAEIKRAVRCLYVPVTTRAELADAIEQIDEEDYALPVNRPLALSEISTLIRENPCVCEYPEHTPECPYCGGKDFAWEDGDDVLFTGDGACSGCGAKISICSISRAVGMGTPAYA